MEFTKNIGLSVKGTPPPSLSILPAPLKSERFFVVGVGGSVKGMAAIHAFLEKLPPSRNFSCVLMLCGDIEEQPVLEELQQNTLLHVAYVCEGTTLQHGHLYFAPQHIRFSIEHGVFHILATSTNHVNMPIDACFMALAEATQEHCMAVLFAGTGVDGIRGIKSVMEKGGFTLSQDAESAADAGMTSTDTVRSLCDRVLPAHLLAEEIPRYLHEPAVFESESAYAFNNETLLEQIFQILKNFSKIDFTYYKLTTIQRRIVRRMALCHIEHLSEYVDFLVKNNEEVQLLNKDILIGVTSFFRNPECFEALRHTAIVPLLQEGPATETLRVWVAGCSTGEEAYSVAILFDECQQALGTHREVKIFATDVDHEAVKIASRGMYSESIVHDVTPDRLEKYFFRSGNQYHVNKSIRKNCVFSPHNLFVNPPFGQLHLITYRNVLIYFQPILQKTIFSTFHDVLKPEGYLFLGKTEYISEHLDAFLPVSAGEKVFRHNIFGQIPGATLSRTRRQTPALSSLDTSPCKSPLAMEKDSIEEALPQILDSLAKSCIVVNEQDEIEHLYGAFESYIRLSLGAASRKLENLLIPELKLAVSSVLSESRQTTTVVTKNGIPFPDGTACSVTVIPLRDSKGQPMKLFAILLNPEHTAPVQYTATQRYQPEQAANKRIEELESELRFLRGSLQYNLSELQTVNEELQTTNEEMHTANEELQTSNEELQSVNEELFTVNAEYQNKLEEVLELNDDMSNFLNSTLIGIVYVDMAMNIRKVTDYVNREFDVTESDIGRSLRYFLHKFDDEELITDVWKVPKTLTPLQREVSTNDEKHYILRVTPYRSVNDVIKGIVLSVSDIGELKSAYTQIEKLSYAIEQIPIGVTLTSLDGRVEYVNPKFTAISGYSPADVLGRELENIFTTPLTKHEKDKIFETIRHGHIWSEDVQCRKQNGELYWERMTVMPVINRNGEVTNYLKLAEDITNQKITELSGNHYRQHLEDMVQTRTLALEHSRNEAQAASKAKTAFLSTVSHEIRTPMNAIMGFTHIFDRTNLSNKQIEQLNKIYLSANTLLAIINDVLDISKIEAGKMELQCVPFSLRTSLETVHSIVADSARTKNLELIVDVHTDTPDWVSGDVLRLNQILLNLLNNAIKFTPTGSVRLYVGNTTPAEAEHLKLTFTVTDTGIGIPAEHLPRLFQAFMQADNTISRRYGGTGLGLAISKQLVELMGGTLHVESLHGAGSTFRFTVQLEPIMAHLDEEGTRAEKKHCTAAVHPTFSTSHKLDGLVVLVVEDNPINQEIACALLEEHGIVSFRAENGHEALKMVRVRRYAGIFMDMQMPEMDGLEATIRLRAMGQSAEYDWLGTVPIIAMTANAMAEDRQRCLAAGMDDHVAKPIDPILLKKTLCRWLAPQ